MSSDSANPILAKNGSNDNDNNDTISTTAGTNKSFRMKKGNPLKNFLGLESNDGGGATKPPVQVEPKSYFANERTFIQWISASLLLLTVSTIIMSDGQFMRTAATIAFTSLFLVVYSTFIYFRRINLLSSGQGYGYIDHNGPAILAVGVSIGILAVFWDIVAGTDMFGEQKGDDRRLRLRH